MGFVDPKNAVPAPMYMAYLTVSYSEVWIGYITNMCRAKCM